MELCWWCLASQTIKINACIYCSANTTHKVWLTKFYTHLVINMHDCIHLLRLLYIVLSLRLSDMIIKKKWIKVDQPHFQANQPHTNQFKYWQSYVYNNHFKCTKYIPFVSARSTRHLSKFCCCCCALFAIEEMVRMHIHVYTNVWILKHPKWWFIFAAITVAYFSFFPCIVYMPTAFLYFNRRKLQPWINLI